jgi:hypothetical protein
VLKVDGVGAGGGGGEVAKERVEEGAGVRRDGLVGSALNEDDELLELAGISPPLEDGEEADDPEGLQDEELLDLMFDD